MKIEDVDFSIECLPEEISIRGNCMASGDDAADEACAVEIERQLEDGNPWAWCTVRVIASCGELEVSEYLGACSYASEEDFRASDYFESMRDEAFEQLQKQVAAIESVESLDGEALAKAVCDAKAAEAIEINSQGRSAQLRYLLGE